ncbi:alanine--tRNA ligase [Candidatus Saccharibacteria bacterium]|nr:alanine--tRNA ligase [Candidatus Saccharibacteria bacterium]
MDANEIRQKYLDFMVKHGYTKIAPVDLILENDPTTLFTGSGMQPMIPYLLGEKHPAGNKLTNSQPCVRTQDMEEVGDNRHTTFFEMLGDWSLDGLDKKQQIEWLFEFLTHDLGLDPSKLYVTCFIGDEKAGIPRDDETANAWAEVFEGYGITAKTALIGSGEAGDKRGIKPGERIFFYDDGQNWWSRNGGIATTPKGDPCGPDNEVFYDFGAQAHDASFGLAHPASDSGRFLEICNKVWMQYQRQADGSFEPLTTGKVDFGGGLSRLASATLGKPDIFLTSLYQPIIQKIEQISGKDYASNQTSMRVIADHLTAAVWLASQGLTPSNKTQGYVLRRLIRRAVRFAFDLGVEQNFLDSVVPTIINIYTSSYPKIRTSQDSVLTTLTKEEKAFRQTLRKGLRVFEKLTLVDLSNILTGKEIFTLYDTYGFPVELSVEEAFKRNIAVAKNWRDEFDAKMAEQRERSQTASKGTFKGGLSDSGEMTTKYHTATHLLLAALERVLGPNVEQKGANITPERLRFDFAWGEKLTPEQIAEVEKLVNGWIKDDLPVTHKEYDTDYALNELHAHGSFREKYGDKITVYTIGDISCEVCGGPHVEHTGQLATPIRHSELVSESGSKILKQVQDDNRAVFKIVKEQSSSAGVRRIKAVLQ